MFPDILSLKSASSPFLLFSLSGIIIVHILDLIIVLSWSFMYYQHFYFPVLYSKYFFPDSWVQDINELTHSYIILVILFLVSKYPMKFSILSFISLKIIGVISNMYLITPIFEAPVFPYCALFLLYFIHALLSLCAPGYLLVLLSWHWFAQELVEIIEGMEWC